MSIDGLLEQALEQAQALPKRKVIISSHGQFATLIPQEISTNPELIRSVESKDSELIEQELQRLGREYDALHPEEGYTNDYDKYGHIIGTRRKTEDEIERRFLTCRVTALYVVEVQGKYRLDFNYDLFEEVIEDQVAILTKVLKLQ